jgi:hypothetical protein
MTKRIKDRFFYFGICTICTATASQEAADPLNSTPQKNIVEQIALAFQANNILYFRVFKVYFA